MTSPCGLQTSQLRILRAEEGSVKQGGHCPPVKSGFYMSRKTARRGFGCSFAALKAPPKQDLHAGFCPAQRISTPIPHAHPINPETSPPGFFVSMRLPRGGIARPPYYNNNI